MQQRQRTESEKSLDEQELETIFKEKDFTFIDYERALINQKDHLLKIRGVDGVERQRYDGKAYQDPHAVQLACIYDLLRHLMVKSANCDNDINTTAYIDIYWQASVREAEVWRLAKKRKYTKKRFYKIDKMVCKTI